MKLTKIPLKNDKLISVDEFKLWARIDNDEEDELLDELLESAINFFELKTNRVLKRAKFKAVLENEKVFFAECDEIKILSGDIEIKTEYGATCFSRSGEVSFVCGYEKVPLMIKLWIKNFALNLYENRVNDYKNDTVISYFRIKEF